MKIVLIPIIFAIGDYWFALRTDFLLLRCFLIQTLSSETLVYF